MASNTDISLRHQVIYSIFARGHTKEGTFRALEADLDRLRWLGADILWLMPIHPIGEAGRKGTVGSPYAIRDYRAVNPDMGTEDDLRHLVDAIHQRGMKCIIDVVYNHTSPDSVLAKTHPEFFLRDAAGQPTRKVADWWDIVDLDYTNRELWRYQIDTLKQWAAIMDGFRCDVASAVPLDFWRQAREEVETVRPGCIWLAESVYGAHTLAMRRMGVYSATDTELQTVFDMTYDYDIWHCFEGVLKGQRTMAEYAMLLTYQELEYPNGYVKARCLENHDTPRIASWLHSDGQLDNWLAFLYFQRGATMLYSGQEYAPKERVDFFEWQSNYGDMQRDLQQYLHQLKAVKLTLPLQGGYWLDTAEGGFLLGHYEGTEGKALGVFHMNDGTGRVAVDLPDGVYANRLGGNVTVRGGQIDFDGRPIII